MSRLIDADKLKEEINSSLNTGRETFSPEIIYEAVDEQPTAFDVNKVVKQLDKASDYYEFDEQGKEHVQMINLTEAIEIVKGGGVE